MSEGAQKIEPKSFLKHTGLLFSGSVVAQAIGFFVLFFLSRIYSPEDFGALGLFNSIVAAVVVFSGMRFEMAIVVEDNYHRAKNLAQLAALFNVLIATVCLLILIFFQAWVVELFQISDPSWLYFIPPVVALSGLIETLVFWHNREKNYKRISGKRIITASTTAAYKSVHPFLGVFSWNGLILGHALGQLAGYITLFRKTSLDLFKVNLQELKEVATEYIHFPKYSAPAALVNILAVNMPIFMLSHFDGLDATGHLSNASRLTYLPLSMLAMASSQVFFERIARIKTDKLLSAKLSHQLYNFLFLLAAVPIAILFVFGDDIVPFLLGDEWQDAGTYVQILILFYFSMFLTSPFSSAFETYNKLQQQLAYNVTFFVLTAAALYIGYMVWDDTTTALICFAVTALSLRIVILNYFFHLFGKSLILKTIASIAIMALLIWLLTWVDTMI